MKVQAVDLPAETLPSWKVELYQDPNGNWFASVESRDGFWTTVSWTATFDSPREAIEEACRINPIRRAGGWT